MNFLKVFLGCLLAVVAGSILTFLFWIFVLVGIAGSMETPTIVKPGSVLRIDLAETLVDSPSNDPFASFDFAAMQPMPRLPLYKALRAVEAAAADDRIAGICLRPNGGGGFEGTALVEELRAAIADFKRSGKFVVAYNEYYTQGDYYLASVADSVYMQPEGSIEWSGLSMSVMFYKGLFDKLDLKAEVFRPASCKYKSAVEPYVLSAMSEANRRQMQALAESVWGTIVEAVSAARGIAPERLNLLADELAVSLPDDALRHGFIDGILYEDELAGVLERLGADPAQSVSLGEYAAGLGPDASNVLAPQVAVVYADGAVVDGEGVTGGYIYGNTLAETLASVRDDDRVRSVVLRVNSPGGSALASDVVWRAMELLRAEKPVVVSMGSYAASGGYYIACPADAILADRMTLTGSIGVYGMYLNTADALKNKLGITLDAVKTNVSAGMGATGALTPAQRASILRGVDRVYATFTEHVAEGRNLPLEHVLDIAQGRVWTGADATGIGLVDANGGLREAIAVAADKADLGADFRVVEVLEQPEGFAALLASLMGQVRASVESSELGVMMKQYRKVQELVKQQGVVMYEPRTFAME
ncbi:signal peptide peptidase SppA [uncultured Alistipes sp.]|uniref:signal peptide peptidase SppA n=1 Tax=uncultured Alistipes sp. TaxID=538949 RepID=UPI0025D2F39C|nr:signal peptide peptidase SppA [uncultured Alistipes sp.]